jgi:photosystem II stability/assembly factor-like uncharacterized protein
MYASIARHAAALLLLCGLASPAWAVINEWTRIGPEIGQTCSLAAAPSRPSTVYAGTESGDLFRSLDAGRTWTLLVDGARKDPVALGSVCLLAIDPASPDTIYAGAGHLSRLYKSTDGGASWTRLAPPITDYIAAVVHHPTRPGTLYVLQVRGPIRRTTDGGRTWSTLPPGSPLGVNTLAIVPGARDVLYAGTEANGVFKSNDGGATWVPLNRGLDPAAWVEEIVVHPRDPRTLLLLASGRVFYSTDAGARWRPANLGADVYTYTIALDPDRPSTFYAAGPRSRIFRSTDGGARWKSFQVPTERIDRLLVLSDSMLAGSFFGGVFRSEDDAVSWSRSSRGLTGGQIVSLAAHPRAPGTLFASDVYLGVHKTRNGGSTWTLRLPLIPAFSDGVLAVDPAAPSNVYAALRGELFASSDTGVHWTRRSGLGCIRPAWIEIVPGQPSTLYTGGHHITVCSPRACTIWKSTDGGQTRSCIRNGLPSRNVAAFAVDPVTPSTLYALSMEVDHQSVGHLYRSEDGGATWVHVSSHALPPRTFDLEIDPVNPSILYTAGEGGVSRSADRGQTWEVRGNGLPPGSFVERVELDPVRPTTLYAMVAVPDKAYSVYKSTDSGETWTWLGQGLGEGVFLTDLLLDPTNPSTLYVGTVGYGIMKLAQEAP